MEQIQAIDFERTELQILQSYLDEMKIDILAPTLTQEERAGVLTQLLSECKKHVKPFVVHVLGLKWYWFHEYWWQDYLKYKLFCEIAARGLGKTTFFTKIIPAYEVFLNWNYEGIIISYNGPATNNFVMYVAQLFKQNQLLHSRISTDIDDTRWNRSDLMFKNGSRVRGIPILSQIRGTHPLYFILDDIMNDEQQKLSMKDVKDKLMGTVYPASLRSRGKVGIIGTLFADNDVYHWIEERAKETEGWTYRKTFVDLDENSRKVYICMDMEDGSVLRVADEYNLFDYVDLLETKKNDPDKFSREFMCVVITDESTAFKYEDCISGFLEKEVFHEHEHPGSRYVAGIDFARSPGDRGDYTVVIVLEVWDDGMKLVRNMLRMESSVPANQQVDAIAGFLKKFGLIFTLCERNNMGMSIIDFLNQEHGLWLEHEYTDLPRRNDMLGFLEHQLQAGKLKFPRGDDACRNKTDIIIDELIRMKRAETPKGLKTYKSSSRHDDCVLSFAYACKSSILNRKRPSQIEAVKALPSGLFRQETGVEYMCPESRKKEEDKEVLIL